MIKKTLLVLLVLACFPVVYVLSKTPPIDPAAYTPPVKPPLTGVLAPNDLLQKAELLAKGKINGPEEVAVDARGRIYAGTQDGQVLRLLPDGRLETFAFTGGRPLGMQFDRGGNLIVCDSYKGLLSVNPAGKITILAQSINGLAFKFTDALDISSEGIIYFTDASYKYGQSEYLYDLLEARPHGRLISLNPSNGEIKVLLSDLYFSNGVALSAHEDFVLVNETYRYRTIRYWLEGPKAGTREVFLDNLPGFPDNITSNRQGTFWLALFTVRNETVDRLHPYPYLKSLLSKLPKAFWPKPRPYGLVLALDENGRIVGASRTRPENTSREVTSAREYDGYLYLGSLHGDRIGRYKLD